MLVFSRKAGEQMWISNTVELTVLGIHGSTVWLGFAAPPGVEIERAEFQICAASNGAAPHAVTLAEQDEECQCATARTPQLQN